MTDRRSFVKDRALHTYRFPTSGQSEVVWVDALGRRFLLFSLHICMSVTQFIGAGLLEVNLQGYLLIAEAVKTSNHPAPPILAITSVGLTWGWWLDFLAANVKSVPLRIVDLNLDEVRCGSAEVAKAFVEMLKHCDHWRVDKLHLLCNVDENFWEELSSVVPIGPVPRDASDGMLRFVRISGKALARGETDQLRRVWRITGGFGSHWWVFGLTSHPKIYRRTDTHWGYGVGVDRESAGWEEILYAIHEVVSVDIDLVSQSEILLISGHSGTVKGQSQSTCEGSG